MIRTVVLAVSIVANAALLALWLGGESEWRPDEGSGVDTSIGVPPTVFSDDFSRWLALGLDVPEARRLLFATREATALTTISSPWRQYWQPVDTAVVYAAELAGVYAALRDDLIRQFGPSAELLPEFARAFRPLDAQFEFLSSTEQISLQSLRLRERVEAMPLMSSCGLPSLDLPHPAAESESLLEFLAPQAAFEVLLRDSASAANLRRSGVKFREAEFRDAFMLLQRLDTNSELDAQLVTRRELQRLLGLQRLAAILAVRDPVFDVLRRIGASQSLDTARIAAGYEAVTEVQNEWLELAAQQSRGELSITAAAAIAAREVEKLSAAIGQPAATAFLAAREEFYMQVRRGGEPALN